MGTLTATPLQLDFKAPTQEMLDLKPQSKAKKERRFQPENTTRSPFCETLLSSFNEGCRLLILRSFLSKGTLYLGMQVQYNTPRSYNRYVAGHYTCGYAGPHT